MAGRAEWATNRSDRGPGLSTTRCGRDDKTRMYGNRGVMVFAMADDEKKEKQCKNPACTCPPQPDGKYCSASCEGAGKTIEIDCDCGHPECGGNF